MFEEFFLLAIVILLIIIYFLYRRNRPLEERIRELLYDKKSLSVKYGKTTEQFLPFIKDYPYNEENFRFIGNPIDGVQFEPDKVVFVEFKTGDSRLSESQKKIKEIVEKKKVEFKEIRIP